MFSELQHFVRRPLPDQRAGRTEFGGGGNGRQMQDGGAGRLNNIPSTKRKLKQG